MSKPTAAEREQMPRPSKRGIKFCDEKEENLWNGWYTMLIQLGFDDLRSAPENSQMVLMIFADLADQMLQNYRGRQ